MSLLLDALNKTSAKSSSADASANSDDEVIANELSPEFEKTGPVEPLSVENTNTSTLAQNAQSNLELEPQETELDTELVIDDTTLDSIVNEHPADQILESAVESASEKAVDDATRNASLSSIPEPANEESPVNEFSSPKRDDQRGTSYTEASSESSIDEGRAEEEVHGDVLLAETNTTAGSTSNGLIIDVEAEPESLAEEVLHDAPLVAAYAKAQKRRKLIIASILSVMSLLVCAFAYKTFFYTPAQNFDATAVDPIMGLSEENVAPKVVLEAIKLSQIPARRTVPNIQTSGPVNTVKVSEHSVNSAVLSLAFEALRNGDLNKASTLYNRMLANPLTRADALAGQASVFIAREDFESATNTLNELLSIDSTNIYAVSVLAAMPSPTTDNVGDINNKTSLLKTLLYANPENADIAYMLGNQLVAEANWPAAQSAYITAHSLNSENPVYALNLAISLDRLGKHKQAREFYEIALRSAPQAHVQIDVNSITRRLQQGK